MSSLSFSVCGFADARILKSDIAAQGDRGYLEMLPKVSKEAQQKVVQVHVGTQ
jgi:hypothetical protein